jgi:hypothetical protein
MAGMILPDEPTAKNVCETARDAIVGRLQDGICSKFGGTKSFLTRICSFAMTTVNDLMEPVSELVDEFCGTILDAVVRALGFEKEFYGFLEMLSSVKGESGIVTGLVAPICGPMVCPSGEYNACNIADMNQKRTLVAKTIEGTPGLCAALAEVMNVLEDSACFTSENTVQHKNGTVVRMDELQVGDEILTESGEYAKVYYFSTQDRDYSLAAIKIKTATAR